MNEPFDHLLKVRIQLPASCPLRILLTYKPVLLVNINESISFPLDEVLNEPPDQLKIVLTGPPGG